MSIDPRNPTKPMKLCTLPTRIWDEISVDFYGPIPNAHVYLMVVIDDYSRYPFVETLQNITAATVTSRLRNIFSVFRTVSVVRTDNGPPFQGREFANFATEMGFKHRRITPLHPEANGIAKRFMKTLTKTVLASHVQGQNLKKELNTFLMNYRSVLVRVFRQVL
jgi:transposase InsO family protein